MEGIGISGQDLGHGEYQKKYNINQNDLFIEDEAEGQWKLISEKDLKGNNTLDYNSDSPLICKIVELKKDEVQIEVKKQTYNLAYNEELNISSNYTVYDGTNYSYTIQIIKI